MSEIYYESIRTLTDRLARRDLSVAELRAELLVRIDALDSRYRAVVATFPGAPESDAYPENAVAESHLAGIPILLKDNIAITGPWPTTAGSRAMADATVRRDASIAAQIRASGMDVLGKTNLSEWANFRSSFSSSGWSSVGGQTVNAFDPSRTPGGSSSGSAVAVALGYVPAAIGTETDGSIVGPSAMNGVVGFKPTVGLVSRHGIIPISSSQDTAGPIARSVEDAAAVLETLCASDANDAATLDRPNDTRALRRPLMKGALRGARLGVTRSYCGFNEAVDEVFERALDDLRRLGATVIDPVELATRDSIREQSQDVMLSEFRVGLEQYLEEFSEGEVRSLRDLIDFNQTHAAEVLPHFGQDLLIAASEAPALRDERYQRALSESRRLAGYEGIDASMTKYQLDALVAPTHAPAWKVDHLVGDNRKGGASTPAAVAGGPHITVPMGQVGHMPVGLSFFGGRCMDWSIMSLAYDYEQATQHFQPPDL